MESQWSFFESAIRELKEELGIEAKPEELHYIGVHYGAFEAEFYGKMFRDNELSSVYLYTEPVEIKDLTLQESEVEEVIWMDYEECRKQVESGELANCIYLDEFRMVGEYLQSRSGQRIEGNVGGKQDVSSKPMGKRMDSAEKERSPLSDAPKRRKDVIGPSAEAGGKDPGKAGRNFEYGVYKKHLIWYLKREPD